MGGLKSSITFTLAATLAAGMLMINLVLVTFWQRSLLRQQVTQTRSILLSIAATGATQTDTLGKTLRQSGIPCGMVLLENQPQGFTQPECGQTPSLEPLARQAFQSGETVVNFTGTIWTVPAPQKRFLLVAVPVNVEHRRVGAIGAVIPLAPLWQSVHDDQKTILVYILVNVLLLTTIGFFRLARSVIRPIDRLVRISSTYGSGSDAPLLPDKEVGEFRQLFSALNNMIANIEADRQKLRSTVQSLEQSNQKLRDTQQEMVRAEKLASVGRLAAGLAHEIGNPIGIIQGYLELLQRDSLTDDNRTQYSTRAMAELERINRLIRQLLDFARTSTAGKKKININALLLEAMDLFANQKKMEQIRFTSALNADHPLVEIDTEGLRQVLLNLLFNSVDAIREKGAEFPGEVTVATTNIVTDSGQRQTVVSVRDNGRGIDQDNLRSIFDPFFTTKEPGKGTGLGLSVSHSIVEAAGGIIKATSTPGEGTEMQIILPTAE